MIWETKLHQTLISKIKHKLYKQPILWTWVNSIILLQNEQCYKTLQRGHSRCWFVISTRGIHRYWLLRRRSWGRAGSSPDARVGYSSQHCNSRRGHSQRATTLSYTLDPAEQKTTICQLPFIIRLLLIINGIHFRCNYISVHFVLFSVH